MPTDVQIVETDPIKLENYRTNSLADLASPQQGPWGPEPTISRPDQMINSADYNTFTLNRTAITYAFKTYGIIRTLIGQPVDDAFRGGIEIKAPEVDDEDLAELMKAMEENDDMEAVKQTGKWARLFGGAGVIAVTDQDPSEPLNPKQLSPNKPLKFLAADRWELILSGLNFTGMEYRDLAGLEYGYTIPGNYNYYGVPLDDSRVMKMLGQIAPSLIRQRLQGWGMSELEQCMRELNSYIKLQNLCFELVDEAKIDIYKIQQFNTALASAQGTALIQLRMQLGNMIKNYQNALVMDADDEYEQKQIAFGGLADILEQFRINLCAALRFPMNKLFGTSATGFASGEDSMENYNAMIEVEVRDRIKQVVRWVIELRMQQLWGYVPEFTFNFKPLRVLTGVEEETVATSKQNRALALFDRDLTNGQETTEILQKEKLLNMETEVGDGAREPEPKAGFGAPPEPTEEDKPGESKGGSKRENALFRLRSMLRAA